MPSLATKAVDQQFCRLNPPQNPSMSSTSPQKYKPGRSLDSIVLGLISFKSTPPEVTTSPSGRVP